MTGHTGHWELLAATVATRFPVTVVARKVNDDRFNDLIVRARRDSGCEVLLRDDPNFLAAARDALRRNRILALLIDQDTRGAGVFVPFFGIPARTPPGAAILAFRGKAPVITAFINRRPEGGHVIRIEPVDLSAHTGRDRITRSPPRSRWRSNGRSAARRRSGCGGTNAGVTSRPVVAPALPR